MDENESQDINNEGNSTDSLDDKKDIAENQTKTENQVQNKILELVEVVKKFNLLTQIGLGLTILFLIFCAIKTFAIRWWLMTPIAAAGVWLLNNQRNNTQDLENKVCVYSLIALIVLFVVRDCVMASYLSDIIDNISKMASEVGKIKDIFGS